MIKRAHYILPVIEEVLPELADARMFSKLDLKDGFLQIELDEESSKLTTFQTPWSRYRWLRLPFGVAPLRAKSSDTSHNASKDEG